MSSENNFCSIGIYLYGENISLDEVSLLVGLEPTLSRNLGDVRFTSSGAKIVQKIGVWEFRWRVEVTNLGISLLDVLDKIKCERIAGRAGVTKAELDIFIPLDTDSDMNGFSSELPGNLLGKLYRLGFDVVITVR